MRETMNYNKYSCAKLLALVLLILVQWDNVCVSGSDSESVQCREEERSALLHINASMSFPIHSLHGKWEGKECCRWERVTCDPTTGHVTQLDLGISDDDSDDDEYWSDYYQVISLNASMFLPLRQLRSLSLSRHGIYNCTDGVGFESWSSLTKLQMLDLSANNLPKSIFSSLANVSSLRALYLDDNPLGGSNNVPVKELSALNLEVLSLRHSMFTGRFPYLGHWSTSLKALLLEANYLNGTLTSEGICQLKNLKELVLSFNNFDGNLPSCMGNLSLRLVDLSHNQFQVKFPSSIFERLVSLRYLSLSNNQLEGTMSINSYSNHSNLEVLGLSTSALNFRVEVVDLPFQLQVLELSNCILDGKPTFWYSQRKLQVLDLSNTSSKGPLSAVGLLLENNPNLIKLDLHKNFFTEPLQLSFLTHENLIMLDISDNHLSEELPANISTKLPNLMSLNLSKNYFHGPLPLISTSNLGILDLSRNNLTGDIQNNFPRIQAYFLSILDLSFNKFYGSFTSSFNFTQAEKLMLNDNNISGEIPISICNTSFDVLDLSNNDLNGVLPDCIGSARYQIVNSGLKLSGNNLEGSLPLEICVVPNRLWLDLSDNKFSGSIPPCTNQSELQIVDLSRNNLIGNFSITWLNNSYIRSIDIGENYLSGDLPIWIGKGSNLRMFQARQNMF